MKTKMNINVFKNNKHYSKIDLTQYVHENDEEGTVLFIGRGKNCQILLEDMKVGRQQAELRYEKDSWAITNHNEFNEIFINGNTLNESVLKNGDVVSIGPFMLAFELDDKISNEDQEPPENAAADSEEGQAELEGDSSDLQEDTAEDDSESEGGIDDDGFVENAGDEFSEAESDFNEEESSEGGDEGELAENSDFEDEQSFSEEGDFDEAGFDDDSNLPVESDGDAESREKTGVFNNFSKFELHLSGGDTPYDKFILDGEEIFIGSDSNECQIVLNNPEVSRTHAAIKRDNNAYILKDLKSKNGIILNGARINSHKLCDGDKFLIGETYFSVKITSDFLRQELDHLMPVEENQVVEVKEIVEVGENFSDVDGMSEEMPSAGEDIGPKSNSLFSKEALQDPEKRKKILMIGIVLLGAWVFLEEDGGKKKAVKKNAKQTKAVKAKREPSSQKKEKPKDKPKVKLTDEQKEFIDMTYVLAKNLFSGGKYRDALLELDRVHQIVPSGYKKSKFMEELTKEALQKEEKLFEEARRREALELKRVKVEKLIKDAQDAFAKENIDLSENLMSKIASLDPDNQDVAELKLRIDAYNKKKEREALEKAEKEAERKRQENALIPGKTFYLKKEWYKAILKLEEFLRRKNTDEDLIQKATAMLTESKKNLKELTEPLVFKAQSSKKNQDLKNAYENYLKIIDYDPAHQEALKEMVFIREKLESRSRKAYREAIIAESLSLFSEAKEKFQEVQQISPTDSKYYKKATHKLKEYLD